MPAPTDPLYPLQWHFPMLGDIETIWADYSGAGVKVGIYDDGIDYLHEDLAVNYDASLHVVNDSNNPVDPFPVGPADGHGTAVAGLIGAAMNGTGSVGVAHGATLTGVNVFNAGVYGFINAVDMNPFMNVMQQGVKFDVINNSWGRTPDYYPYDYEPTLDAIYSDLVATGRGGFGTVIVQSAGNNSIDSNGSVANASRFTATIAATLSGQAAWYSNHGTSILVAAPAAAFTTDRTDDADNLLSLISVPLYSTPSFVDIDDDGDLDVVVGTDPGALHTFINTGTSFVQATGAANPFNGITGLTAPSFVDLDGDGRADLVSGAANGQLRSFRNEGAGVFTALTGADNPFNGVDIGSYSTPSFADIDGDGDMDALLGNQSGGLLTFFNNGSGVFTQAIGGANPFNGLIVEGFSTPAFVDIDLDGDMDAVVGSQNGTLRTYLNNGAGVFTVATGAANPFNGFDVGRFSAPTFADIDDDGDMDAVVGEEFGTLYVLFNDGTGAFTSQSRFGYSDGEYTSRFGGTSASAPVTSGVVALMLEANPDLGWRDVQNILANSATFVGSAYTATVAGANENGVWQSNSAANWNGGGMHIHTNYGYGTVNAYNAVRMAEVWSLFGEAQTSQNEIEASGSAVFNVNATSAIAGGVTRTIDIIENVFIDHVALTLDFTGYIWDLFITLTSPDGTSLVVSDRAGDSSWGVAWPWTFGIDHLRGELSAGTWTLNIIDRNTSRSDFIRDAKLDIYGSSYSPDTVHHITDEFMTMVGFDPARSQIVEADGGRDWLNLAAVTEQIELFLNDTGGSLALGGVAAASLQGAFENAVGGDSNDGIYGNSFANEFHGGRGDDIIVGRDGADRLFGGRGHDVLYGGADDDNLEGGDGNDTLRGGAGDDVIDGGDGNDTAVFTGTANTFVDLRITTEQNTGHGLDRLVGIENILASAGNDHLIGNAANNILNGGSGHDSLSGGEGNDDLHGGTGDDVLEGGTGNDILRGGAGSDTALFTGAVNTVADLRTTAAQDTGHGVDRLFGIENLFSGEGDDWLIGSGAANLLSGGEGNDSLSGLLGDDTLEGGVGDDLMIGGAGTDTALFTGAIDTVVDLRKTGPQNTNHGLDTLRSIENVTSDAGADLLIGNNGANVLNAGAGDDVLRGGRGDDTLIGGLGNDILSGGPGADVFIFDTGLGPANVDVILDFTVLLDRIGLGAAIFDVLPFGGLAATAFASLTAGENATADHRIIYAFDLGDLFYDSDGEGGVAAVKFAQLDAGLALSHTDFFVF
ncbi:S8 family serine peptidase [Pseudotabrizicola algicola]|uniref:S8 family serine peptidase n=1 Tax=Pseudotabrizicola algicola TaxID=2709381 RepID=A0A6B3RXB4_9RHOB|nr:S8 family serine peptidase [Pseudotabrizicola algicola]NEX47729.1 S8 family serine peptidase [Pseudotabrizicola algicola]